MGLLRSASRATTCGLRSLTPLVRPLATPIRCNPHTMATRCFAQRSLPRLGHNLEDHYDMAEFVCRIHNPLGEYITWFALSVMALTVFGPLVHSNYYFTGRFLPKDQGNTQLCDESW
mmetsp:Transcript_66036/g.104544  ORF Transcript_66036/g.104544 Transcript_66036/m.104544 type:complete len:117 (+) Transcript_66036:69-419(+)